MNYLNRAILSIARRKSKSIILLIIIFILGNVIAGSVSIQQATQNVETNIKNRLGAAAVITEDYELLNTVNWQDADDNSVPKDYITPEIIENIGNLPQVNMYDYNTSLNLPVTDYLTYTEEGQDNSGRSFFNEFTIKGVHNKEISDFAEGRGNLIDGRTFNDHEIANGSYVGVISKEVAEINNLRVGDTMPLKNAIYYYGDKMTGVVLGEPVIFASQDMPVEIIGIHEPVFDSSSWRERQGHQNTIYMPVKTAITEITFREEQYTEMYSDRADNQKLRTYYDHIYLLNSPEDAEDFRNNAQRFLPEYYLIYASSDQYEQIAGGLVSMKSLSSMVLYVAVGATIFILTLLIILFLRDRKHELGIYLSLGEKRLTVILQVVLEVVPITFVAISISLFTGNLIARQVSDQMIINQMENHVVDERKGYNLPYGENVSQNEIMEAYEVGLNLSYILLMYVIGLGTVIIAAVGPMIYILRLNPKKILL